MRVGSHAPMPRRGELCELLAKLAVAVEQFMRPIALQPVFEQLQMLRLLEIGDRDLMGAPGALDGFAVDEFGAGPTLRRAEHDYRPTRSLDLLRAARGPRDA